MEFDSTRLYSMFSIGSNTTARFGGFQNYLIHDSQHASAGYNYLTYLNLIAHASAGYGQ